MKRVPVSRFVGRTSSRLIALVAKTPDLVCKKETLFPSVYQTRPVSRALRTEDCIIDSTCVMPPNPIPGQVDGPSRHVLRCVMMIWSAPSAIDAKMCRVYPGAREFVMRRLRCSACPDGSNQTCGGVCPVAAGINEVDVSHCILLDQGAGGYCSCSCASAAQCPSGFVCSRDVIPTGDPARPGICLPVAGYTCPQGGDSCLSTICASQRPGSLYRQCTAPCVGPQDCPEGMICVEDPELGMRVCVTP